ncbi:elongation factor Ts [Algimonas ampicilliniresistens]|jgi:elongation factor Ts|uniref:Elongation factor Ts n=1 Tax=Algimonas ampicilliniresistens TaxID=1298735 RepID=A0ABQ5V7C5_9PROT|nr:translation elongation factor Ts [Algimonas ampicilliniresistens]GLQ23431.1 elongation factor Ts [Algimonas ampicilliniresistens]
MAITAAMVKELRDKTSAGMMDCKKALNETNGDMDAAVDWLRTKGIAKADKKASRVAAEGLVAATTKGTKGVVVEVNSETDFVARNDIFQATVAKIATRGLDVDSSEALASTELEGGKTVTEYLSELVGKIGENMTFRRMETLEVSEGIVASYIHNSVATDMGKIGVLVALESSGDVSKLDDLAKKIAMHVAATAPLANTVEDLDATLVSKEREMLKAEALESGKPENIVDKMVDGRMQKFFKESVLATQIFVMDGERSIEKVLEDEGKALGADIKLTGFVRMAVGEGIEKKEENFAEEVAALKG